MKKTSWAVSAAAFFVFFFGISPALGIDVTWNPAIDLSAGGQEGDLPRVTMDDAGHVVAVWMACMLDSTRCTIQAAASSDYGASWSTPANLSAAGSEVFFPQATMDETGHVVAVWLRNSRVQSSVSSDYGASWLAPVNLGDSGENWNLPQVIMDETGHVVAVWDRNGIVQSSVSSDYGASWSGTSDLSGARATRPHVTMDETGHAIAVWAQWAPMAEMPFSIHGCISSDYGYTWESMYKLDPISGLIPGRSDFPRVTMDETGHVVAVWMACMLDSTRCTIQAAASSDYGASWSTPANLSAAGSEVFFPQATIDETGHVVAVWKQAHFPHDVIMARHSSDYGASWSQPVDVPAGGRVELPYLTMDGTGHVVVVWRTTVGGVRGIIWAAASSDYGGNWSTPVNLSAGGTDANNPHVTTNETGHAVAVWAWHDGSNWIIQASATEDRDADGVGALLDNCPDTANADQTDSDGDGMGDACDPQPFVDNRVYPLGDGDGGCFIGTAVSSLSW